MSSPEARAGVKRPRKSIFILSRLFEPFPDRRDASISKMRGGDIATWRQDEDGTLQNAKDDEGGCNQYPCLVYAPCRLCGSLLFVWQEAFECRGRIFDKGDCSANLRCLLPLRSSQSRRSFLATKQAVSPGRIGSSLTMSCSIAGTQSLPPPSLPQLVAEQHVAIPPTDKDSQRLIVVLSNASLETYKAAHGGAGRNGIQREEKYSLLNSDEHIGIMRKMNRDISDARPDITHQVREPNLFFPPSATRSTAFAAPVSYFLSLLSASNMLTRPVSLDLARFPHQQVGQATDLHPHCQGCPD